MVNMKDSKYPHIKWLDLKDDGVMTECAIMRVDESNNDVYFFPLTGLDDIDKKRLFDIVTSRNATMFELWDLMKNTTLKNGVNALHYFHQLVKIRTDSGRVIDIVTGRRGTTTTRTAAPRASTKPVAAKTVAAKKATVKPKTK